MGIQTFTSLWRRPTLTVHVLYLCKLCVVRWRGKGVTEVLTVTIGEVTDSVVKTRVTGVESSPKVVTKLKKRWTEKGDTKYEKDRWCHKKVSFFNKLVYLGNKFLKSSGGVMVLLRKELISEKEK